MDVYAKAKALNINLTGGVASQGLYRTVQETDNGFLYTSGTGCRKDGAPLFTGRLGKEVTLDQGKACARQCMLNLLGNLHDYLGDLNRIKRIVKVLGFVASANDFYKQTEVMNAASRLLNDLFDEDGIAARSAIGVNVLPGNQPVEIELIIELKKEEAK